MDISERQTSKKTYSEMSEEPAPELLPLTEAMAGSKSRRYTLKPRRELNVTGLKIVESVNYHFGAAVNYRNYRLLKTLSGYDNDLAQKLHRIAKKLAVQM